MAKAQPVPTESEIAAAEAVLARAAAARQAADREFVQPVIDLAGSDSFKAVRQAMDAMDRTLVADERVRPLLHAMDAGMRGLALFVSTLPAAPDQGTEASPAAPE